MNAFLAGHITYHHMDDPFKAQQPRGLQPESYVNTPLIDAKENSGVFFYLYY